MKKRLLAIIATAAMVVTMIPAMAFADSAVAKVGDVGYNNLQEAIKAAAPNGTVEIVDDVTVDKWVMFEKSLGNHPGVIDLYIDGLTINGNGYSLTVNSIESASNGNRLFYDAENLNINNLTINLPDGGSGIGLKSGKIENVTFNGGTYGVLPGNGEIVINDCTFKSKSHAVYYEAARDNLTVSGCTFDVAASANIIILRGKEVFKGNTINSGRTVNVASGSPVVEGNDFNDVRLKVYNDATATISNNTVSNLVFDKPEEATKSTFKGNTLSEDAEEALTAAKGENLPKDPAPAPAPTPSTPAQTPENSPNTGDNSMAPFAVAGLVMAAMAAVVATRRRTN